MGSIRLEHLETPEQQHDSPLQGRSQGFESPRLHKQPLSCPMTKPSLSVEAQSGKSTPGHRSSATSSDRFGPDTTPASTRLSPVVGARRAAVARRAAPYMPAVLSVPTPFAQPTPPPQR